MNVLRRGTAVTLLVAGSLSVSLAGCGALTGVKAAGHSHGQVVISYAGYGGPTLLSADQRTVTVAGFTLPCFGTVHPIARETRTRVALWLKYLTPVHHGVCNMSMAMAGPQNIRLAAPLHSRQLVDGATGRVLHWFDRRNMLRPAFIPAGYKLQDITPFLVNSVPPSSAPACRQDYRSGDATLSIIQSAGTLELPQASGNPAAAIRVRGFPGYASADAITWHENGYAVLIEAYPDNGTGPVFTIATLIAIADSAPRAGP